MEIANAELKFSEMIERLKEGGRAVRNNCLMPKFIVFMPPMQLSAFNTQDTERKVNDRTAKYIGESTPLNCLGYFAISDDLGNWQPGWLPTADDILATDWVWLDY